MGRQAPEVAAERPLSEKTRERLGTEVSASLRCVHQLVSSRGGQFSEHHLAAAPVRPKPQLHLGVGKARGARETHAWGPGQEPRAAPWAAAASAGTADTDLTVCTSSIPIWCGVPLVPTSLQAPGLVKPTANPRGSGVAHTWVSDMLWCREQMIFAE